MILCVFVLQTEDSLRRKGRNRSDRASLVNMHILQASTAERSIPTAQMKLKRARLADDLNEKIALRPGPLELVEKNILPMDSSVKDAIKGTEVNYSKAADAFAFEDDSSRDGLSPDQARSEDPQGSAGSTPDIKSTEAPLAGPLDTIQVKQTGLPHTLRLHIVIAVAGVSYSPLTLSAAGFIMRQSLTI